MSLIPTCVCCDALLRGYKNDCLCDRCQKPCPTCHGDVAYCDHPLPVLDRFEATPCPADARKLVAERAEQQLTSCVGDPLLKRRAA